MPIEYRGQSSNLTSIRSSIDLPRGNCLDASMKDDNAVVVAVGMIVIVLIGTAAVLFALAADEANIPLEIGKALVSLSAALLVTGILSAVIARKTRDELQREAAARAAVSALQDLKSAYELVNQARFRLLHTRPRLRSLQKSTLSPVSEQSCKDLNER
jgi:hypothetical protein